MTAKLYSSVDNIQILDYKGPWNSKSGGQLHVMFAIPYDVVIGKYFNYDDDLLRDIPQDIRGLRAYCVSNVAKGSIGANEWHKVRHELVFSDKGSFRWTCEDAYGKKKEFVLAQGHGAWIPNGILHTYEALEDDSAVFVIANTLFDADVPATHDSYGIDAFRALQEAAGL